jgi:hypothetical protein
MILSITSVIMLFSPDGWGSPALVILLVSIFCGVFYLFARMHLFDRCMVYFYFIFHRHSRSRHSFTTTVCHSRLSIPCCNLAAPLRIFIINITQKPAPLVPCSWITQGAGSRTRGFVMGFDERVVSRNLSVSGYYCACRDEGQVYTKDSGTPGRMKDSNI